MLSPKPLAGMYVIKVFQSIAKVINKTYGITLVVFRQFFLLDSQRGISVLAKCNKMPHNPD